MKIASFLAARRTCGRFAPVPADRLRTGKNPRHLNAKTRSSRPWEGVVRFASELRPIGSLIPHDISGDSDSGDRSPRTPDMQDSDFPGGNHRAVRRGARPTLPSRVRHALGFEFLNQSRRPNDGA